MNSPSELKVAMEYFPTDGLAQVDDATYNGAVLTQEVLDLRVKLAEAEAAIKPTPKV